MRRARRYTWQAGARLAALLLSLAAMLALAPGRASADEVDLQLVLAVDASGSVNETRFELQKRGYSAAFRHPRVLRAIQSGPRQRIAVTMVQWTGPALQVQVVPWTLVGDEASMQDLARAIDAAPRRLFSGGTSISGAIDYGLRLIGESPFSAARSVIDVSGDGANNRGRPASQARDEAVARGVVINGLPILELEPRLDDFYLNNVIGGPNSFMVPAATFDEFADAILKKLIIEIAELPRRGIGVGERWQRACARC